MRKKISQTFSVLTEAQENSIKDLALQNNELLTNIKLAVSPPIKIAKVAGAILPALILIMIRSESEINNQSKLASALSLYGISMAGMLLFEVIAIRLLPTNVTGTPLPSIYNINSQDADKYINHLTYENKLLEEYYDAALHDACFLRITIPSFSLFQHIFPTVALLSIKQSLAAGVILGPIIVILSMYYQSTRNNTPSSKIESKLKFFYSNPDQAIAIAESQTPQCSLAN